MGLDTLRIPALSRNLCSTGCLKRFLRLSLPLAALLIARAGAEPAATVPLPQPTLTSRPLYQWCAELGKKYGTQVSVDPPVRDLLVLWNNQRTGTVAEELGKLGELAGCQLQVVTSASGTKKYSLRRSPVTSGREQAWYQGALLRSQTGIKNAPKGKEAPAAGADPLGNLPHVKIARRLLTTVPPEEAQELLKGRPVRLRFNELAESEREQFYSSMGNLLALAGDRDAQIQSLRTSVEKHGLHAALQPSPSEMDDSVYLMLLVGNARTGAVARTTVYRHRPGTVPLPLTHRNPYELLKSPWLERQLRSATPVMASSAELPARFQEPLGTDFEVPAGNDWASALSRFAALSGLEVLSDDFRCRLVASGKAQSLRSEIRIPRDTTKAAALDLLCQLFGYIWWQAKGVVYCRSNRWAEDTEREVPAGVLDRLRGELAQSRAMKPETFELIAGLSSLQRKGFAVLALQFNQRGTATGLFNPEIESFFRFLSEMSPARRATLYREGLLCTLEDVPNCGILDRFNLKRAPVRLTLRQTLNEGPKDRGYDWDVDVALDIKQEGGSGSSSPFPLFKLVLPRLWAAAQ